MKASTVHLYKRLAIASLIAIAVTLSGPASSASPPPKLVYSFNLMEYYPDGRNGTVQIYSVTRADFGMPISTLNPSLKPLDTGLGVITTWISKGGCNGSFLAGGKQVGWLLGPVTDKATVQSYDPYATIAYGVITGVFGDIGYAVGNNCNGTTYNEKWSYWLIFLRPNPGYFQGQGYLIGDGLYMTDKYPQGNWYYIYSDKPL